MACAGSSAMAGFEKLESGASGAAGFAGGRSRPGDGAAGPRNASKDLPPTIACGATGATGGAAFRAAECGAESVKALIKDRSSAVIRAPPC